jgi:hypothetical protein
VEKPLHLVVDCCVADTLFATQPVWVAQFVADPLSGFKFCCPVHFDCCVADTLFAAQFWLPDLLLICHLDSHAAALCILNIVSNGYWNQ